ncbi:hypothetical protein Cgig2_010825 [Carnegiea gigantea]|uniref:Uncharacterized protein n=1 Tax=Carnegiea gigantea TaxID=171969 RepID=A0A9Q1GX87_9CARY|nr:hypothetical protein Cgig2_010825 [Carnegiea gigantea]
MAFPRSLSTSKMAQYVAHHFEWDRRGVAFPPLPLLNDFQALCPSYELDVADEAERLGVLHGRTFRIMESALIELRWSAFEVWEWFWRPDFGKRPSKKKGARMLRGPPPLQTTTRRSEAGQEGETMGEREQERKEEREGALLAPFIMAFPSLHDTREMADFVRESFIWHWTNATRPPRSLPDNYCDLCPRFTLSDAKIAAFD